MAAARRDGQIQQSLRLKVMEAGSRTKTRGVLVCDPPAVCSSPRGAEDECSVHGPHLPLISPPSVSSSAFPAVFLLWSLCFPVFCSWWPLTTLDFTIERGDQSKQISKRFM